MDGMRASLRHDFEQIYHVDLDGNIRRNPKISGSSHNVFGIKVGVGITTAVRKAGSNGNVVRRYRVDDYLRRDEKLVELSSFGSVGSVKWTEVGVKEDKPWVTGIDESEFERFELLAADEIKRSRDSAQNVICKTFGRGLETTRDAWVYSFSRRSLVDNVTRFTETYNAEVDRWFRSGKPADLDGFVITDDQKIKWSSRLKETLRQGVYAEFDESKIRTGCYRPFVGQYVFFDRVLNHRRGVFPRIFPTPGSEAENVIIWVKCGMDWPFFCLACNRIVDLLPQGGSQCFPFYTYNEDGTNRRENITDWALEKFRSQYSDPSITKWDIFYYVHGVLHHPGYREKFADNLKRELPRIPFAPDFRAFAEAGRELARRHLDYEEMEPYPLEFVENPELPLSYRVEDKMRLNKTKTELKVNPSLTLRGIPETCFEYRLGNRSALDWVINQYRVTEHKRSGIVSDPNREDDPEYIVGLVGQVIRVSLDTVRIVSGLPAAYC